MPGDVDRFHVTLILRGVGTVAPILVGTAISKSINKATYAYALYQKHVTETFL